MTENKKNTPEPVHFEQLPLSDETLAGLKTLGYELATPVQSAALGPALEGHDLLVQSKTGTGKTTAFGLPLVERIRVEPGLIDPQAIVLCPTRELAIQVAEEIAELGDPKGVRVLPIYGGTPMGPQLASLKDGCDIIVGTPGRVLDHVRRRTLRLVHVHLAVLDEADEMLSMGFWDDVTAILDAIASKPQTFLFSATLPDEIRRAAAKYLKDPVRLDISQDKLTVEGIENIAYFRDDALPKPRNLLYIIEVEKPENAIIFCNMRQDAQVVASFLRRQGLNAMALSGDLNQRDRERIMKRMKVGELQFLVATDIAARGIDISDLSHVFLYSLPDFTEVYLHRVGRTGRIGKKGTAISLISGKDECTMTQLKRDYNVDFENRTLPSKEDILDLQSARVCKELALMGREVEITAFLPLAKRLKTLESSTPAIAFLLRHYYGILEDEREKEALERDRKREKDEDAKKAKRRAEAARDLERKTKSKSKADRNDDDRPRTNDRDHDADAPDFYRLFISLGSNQGFDESKLVDLVLEAADGGDAGDLKKIQVRRTHSFVQAPIDIAEKAIAKTAQGMEVNDKPVTIERARTR